MQNILYNYYFRLPVLQNASAESNSSPPSFISIITVVCTYFLSPAKLAKVARSVSWLSSKNKISKLPYLGNRTGSLSLKRNKLWKVNQSIKEFKIHEWFLPWQCWCLQGSILFIWFHADWINNNGYGHCFCNLFVTWWWCVKREQNHPSFCWFHEDHLMHSLI